MREIDPARIRRQIAQRLSLRTPQENALRILADVAGRMDWDGPNDAGALLAEIGAEYPSVESFERDFPSLCFALATGVGKTRLMGAFIAFLFLTGRSKNFFVLAPNTTIYDKLVADFSKSNAPKYVFKGVAEFAQNPPIVVTGDTWEEGRGVREQSRDLFAGDAVINIFNVDKINKEKGRIRSMRETLGTSYFDYLSGLPDLVMLMDEAHRYRAKAAAQAVFDLRPRLGLELTATPKSVGGASKPFRNVIYDYPLGQAMADGYVKEPAVATRANFRRDQHDRAEIERMMLDDGATYHEHVKVELDLYARQTGRARVHPFMLVVAQDTTHAGELRALIEADDFRAGAYKGRVAEVHSNLSGEESNEAAAKLVGLETDAATDIVIHVNKLKEGWDVTNLYTIVPLRASASDILTEQTLGRGLRLPYGKRTGNEAVDTLTVIAHDRFDEVIKAAKDANSILREIKIGDGGTVTGEAREVLSVMPMWESAALAPSFVNDGGAVPFRYPDAPPVPPPSPSPERVLATQTTMQLIREKYERRLTGGLSDLIRPEIQAEIASDVRNAIGGPQGSFDAVLPQPEIMELVSIITASIAAHSIEIPEVVVLPSREVNFWFEDFDLTGLDTIRFQATSGTILIRNLRDDAQRELAREVGGPREARYENYIVLHLIGQPEIDYDTQADLLYKLAGQVVARLEAYLTSTEAVEAVALEHGKALARFVFEQMRAHYRETPVEYRATKVRSFKALAAQQIGFSAMYQLPLDRAAEPLSATSRYSFYGARKSPYPQVKFDSDAERRFACVLDRLPEVVRWLRPAPGQFDIEYQGGRRYEPDFVIETTTGKIIAEVKADRDLGDATVREKERAARTWVEQANSFSDGVDDKRWRYALVPDRSIGENLTLSGIG